MKHITQSSYKTDVKMSKMVENAQISESEMYSILEPIHNKEENCNDERVTHVSPLENTIRSIIYKHSSYVDTNWVKLDVVCDYIKSSIPNDININELYDYISDYCASKISTHPDYNVLASRICVDRLHNITEEDILSNAEKLYANLDIKGRSQPLINENLYNMIKKYHKKINDKIDMNRDYLLDYFGLRTLERSYLLKVYSKNKKIIVERPQHMFMRVALGIHGNSLKCAFETYDLMSLKYMTHATPTLFNSGTPYQQLSSCFLLAIDDDLHNIFTKQTEIGMISKRAGGIGVHLSGIRCKGSLIRTTNGLSEGIIPLCSVLNKQSRYVNQGGKRPGSIACFVENTNVLTINNGVKKIQDVQVGDLVVTHRNRVMPVDQVHKNPLNNRIIFKLKVENSSDIYVTGNHEFLSCYTIDNDNKIDLEWNSIENLKTLMDTLKNNVRCYISMPSETGIFDDNQIIDISDYREIISSEKSISNLKINDLHVSITSNNIEDCVNRFWNFNEDFSHLVGVWLASGNIKRQIGRANV
mgnify:CR=1 FL=1